MGRASTQSLPARGGARDMRTEGFVPPPRTGRGGSVSRRDLNQSARNHAQLPWAHKPKRKVKSIPSHSSGERGLGGEALLLEKRPLPPVVPHRASSGGSAREGLLSEKPPPSHPPFLLTSTRRGRRIRGSAARRRCGRLAGAARPARGWSRGDRPDSRRSRRRHPLSGPSSHRSAD